MPFDPDLLMRLTFCAASAAALPDSLKQGMWEKAAKTNPEDPRKEYFRIIFQDEKDIVSILDSIKD